LRRLYSKWLLIVLISHIGVETPEDNIRIMIVEPGIVETELQDRISMRRFGRDYVVA
jgi:hypothetical protein